MPNAFRRGEHICALYETEEEQLAFAAEYLADGLRTGQRVLYAAQSTDALARFRRAMTKLGIEVVDHGKPRCALAENAR